MNDVEAPDVLPVCYQVKAGALCLPFANPRHSHEVDAFRVRKLPDRMTLVCGVVEMSHNYAEHPLVIAERLERACRAVGDRERGHGRNRLWLRHHCRQHSGVWGCGVGKLEVMCDGAAIASRRLWS